MKDKTATQIQVSLRKEERAAVIAAAERERLTMSAWVRREIIRALTRLKEQDDANVETGVDNQGRPYLIQRNFKGNPFRAAKTLTNTRSGN